MAYYNNTKRLASTVLAVNNNSPAPSPQSVLGFFVYFRDFSPTTPPIPQIWARQQRFEPAYATVEVDVDEREIPSVRRLRSWYPRTRQIRHTSNKLSRLCPTHDNLGYRL